MPNTPVNRAYIKWPDGSISQLKVKKATLYDHGNVLIEDTDGDTYFLNMVNCILTYEKD